MTPLATPDTMILAQICPHASGAGVGAGEGGGVGNGVGGNVGAGLGIGVGGVGALVGAGVGLKHVACTRGARTVVIRPGSAIPSV